MIRLRNAAKINIKALVTVIAVAFLLSVGLLAARHLHRRYRSASDLAAGKAAYEKENWSAAQAHFSDYLSRNEEDVDVLTMYAHATLSIRPIVDNANYKEAGKAYRQILRHDPDNGLAYKQLSRLYRKLESWRELVYVSKKWNESSHGNADAAISLAITQMATKKVDEAIETLDGLTKRVATLPDKRTEHIDACLLLATIAKGPEERQGWLEEAKQRDPNDAKVLARQAAFLRDSVPDAPAGLGDLTRAQSLLSRTRSLDIPKPTVRLMLCGEWIALGRKWRTVAEGCKTAATIGRKEGRKRAEQGAVAAQASLAACYDNARAELDAVADVNEADLLEDYLDPNEWLIAKLLKAAQLAKDTGQPTDVVDMAQETLPKLCRPAHLAKMRPLALKYAIIAGDAKRARQWLNDHVAAVAELLPGNRYAADIPILEALVYQAEGRPYDTINALESLTAQRERETGFWRLLIHAYAKTGQTRLQIKALQEYLRLKPRDADMLSRLAIQYAQLGRWGKVADLIQRGKTLGMTNLPLGLVQVEAEIHLAAGMPPSVRDGRLARASKLLAGLRKEHDKNESVRILDAAIAQAREDLPTAMKQLALAVKECPSAIRASMRLARLQFITSTDKTEALTTARAACKRYPEHASVWILLAQMLRATDDRKGAREVLADAQTVAQDSDRQALVRALAYHELRDGNRQAGITLLRKLADADPSDVSVRTVLLATPEVTKDPDTAQVFIDEIRAVEKDAAVTWRAYQARMWMMGDDWRDRQQDIEATLEHCLARDPGWSPPAILLGELHRRTGVPGRTERFYRKVLASNPAAVDVADRLVDLLYEQRRIDEATQVLGQIEANPTSLRFRRAGLALANSDVGAAIEQLQLQAAADPKDSITRIRVGYMIYQQSQDAAAALRYLDEAKAISPESAAMASVRAMILAGEGRTDEARALLDERVARDNSFQAYFRRAVFLAGINQFDLAEKDYRHLTTFSGTPNGFVLLARYYHRTKRLADATACLEEGAKAHPDFLPMKTELARVLMNRRGPGDLERAGNILTALEAIAPDSPAVMGNRALLILLSPPTDASRQKAKELLQASVAKRPDAHELQYHLIRIVLGEGKCEEARLLALRASAATPNNLSLLLAQAAAEAGMGDWTRARKTARRTLAAYPESAEAIERLRRAAAQTMDAQALADAVRYATDALPPVPEQMGTAKSSQLLVIRAKALIALGRGDEAVSGLRAHIGTEQGAKDLAALLALTQILTHGDQPVLALDTLEQAKQLVSGPAAAYAVESARLAWLSATGDHAKLAEQTTTDPRLAYQAGCLLLGESPQAYKDDIRRLLSHALDDAPEEFTQARAKLAALTYLTAETGGQKVVAKQRLREFIEAHPRNAGALNNLASFLYEEKEGEGNPDLGEAMKLARQGARSAPFFPAVRNTLGHIYRKAGKLAEAQNEFERAVALRIVPDANRAKALLELGRICRDLSRTTHARKWLTEAKGIDEVLDVFTAEERDEIARALSAAPST